jgi:hypothetical protein
VSAHDIEGGGSPRRTLLRFNAERLTSAGLARAKPTPLLPCRVGSASPDALGTEYDDRRRRV